MLRILCITTCSKISNINFLQFCNFTDNRFGILFINFFSIKSIVLSKWGKIIARFQTIQSQGYVNPYIYTRRDSAKINEPCMFMPATLILHHWNLNAFLPGIQGHIVVVLFNMIMNYTDQISNDDSIIRNAYRLT